MYTSFRDYCHHLDLHTMCQITKLYTFIQSFIHGGYRDWMCTVYACQSSTDQKYRGWPYPESRLCRDEVVGLADKDIVDRLSYQSPLRPPADQRQATVRRSRLRAAATCVTSNEYSPISRLKAVTEQQLMHQLKLIFLCVLTEEEIMNRNRLDWYTLD